MARRPERVVLSALAHLPARSRGKPHERAEATHPRHSTSYLAGWEIAAGTSHPRKPGPKPKPAGKRIRSARDPLAIRDVLTIDEVIELSRAVDRRRRRWAMKLERTGEPLVCRAKGARNYGQCGEAPEL